MFDLKIRKNNDNNKNNITDKMFARIAQVVEHYTIYLKLQGSITMPTISTCSAACFYYIEFVTSA